MRGVVRPAAILLVKRPMPPLITPWCYCCFCCYCFHLVDGVIVFWDTSSGRDFVRQVSLYVVDMSLYEGTYVVVDIKRRGVDIIYLGQHKADR